MRVVEVGCGDYPGPFFDGADVHYIVDTDRTALERAATRHPEFTALTGSDARNLDLPTSSVDIVLARNVFGDPELGSSAEDSGMHFGMALTIIATQGLEAYQAVKQDLDAMHYNRKIDIIQEAARILVSNGRLIAVEQLTPWVAQKFFNQLATDTESGLEFVFTESSVTDAIPPQYAATHSTAGARTWIGTWPG